MLIQPKNSKIYCSCDILLNGSKLKFVEEYKYLGIIVQIMLNLNCFCLFVPICSYLLRRVFFNKVRVAYNN